MNARCDSDYAECDITTGDMRFVRRARDADEISIGSRIRTPLGLDAVVTGYRGHQRGHRVWLVCRYLRPVNRAFGTVLMLPELVEVIGG